MGPRREFARRLAKGIRKLIGNTPGDRWKKTRRLTARMPKAAGLAGANCQRLSMVESPKSMGKSPVPGFLTVDDG
ncbi:hypothetical protein GW17_00002764 [Ensete ventricosum]|nr:hypothetical protein GW17_00002764 [Ensete ventricosum]